MERQTVGVCFLLRKCKADKQYADIYVHITVDGEEAALVGGACCFQTVKVMIS